jgi:hypothetical protein
MTNAETPRNRFESRREGRRELRLMMAALGCMVVLLTAVALMVPAISMTHGELICGLQEHTHSADCYSQVLVCDEEEGEEHKHSDDCYKEELTCGIDEHKHSDEC